MYEKYTPRREKICFLLLRATTPLREAHLRRNTALGLRFCLGHVRFSTLPRKTRACLVLLAIPLLNRAAVYAVVLSSLCIEAAQYIVISSGAKRSREILTVILSLRTKRM